MLYALLILGLLPAVFLPDYLADEKAEGDEPSDRQDSEDEAVDLLQDDPDAQIAALLPSDKTDASAGPDDTETALPPVDEDDAVPAELAALQPVIEDDLPPSPAEDPDDIQAPVVEDDAPGGQPDPDDVLSPVIEDDVAADDQDPPLGPEDGSEPAESDIWLEAGDLDPDGYAEISGFEPGRDVLNVVFEADHGLPDLDVSVQLSEAGDDTEVFVGGRLIAVLLAAPDVMADEIIVSVQGV